MRERSSRSSRYPLRSHHCSLPSSRGRPLPEVTPSTWKSSTSPYSRGTSTSVHPATSSRSRSLTISPMTVSATIPPPKSHYKAPSSSTMTETFSNSTPSRLTPWRPASSSSGTQPAHDHATTRSVEIGSSAISGRSCH